MGSGDVCYEAFCEECEPSVHLSTVIWTVQDGSSTIYRLGQVNNAINASQRCANQRAEFGLHGWDARFRS